MVLEDLLAKTPLQVRPLGKTSEARIIAAAKTVKGGVIFLDPFYFDVGSHPAHYLRGTLEGTGPWRIGKAVIEVIEHGGDLAHDYNVWDSVRQSDPRYDDAGAEYAIKGFADEMRLELLPLL